MSDRKCYVTIAPVYHCQLEINQETDKAFGIYRWSNNFDFLRIPNASSLPWESADLKAASLFNLCDSSNDRGGNSDLVNSYSRSWAVVLSVLWMVTWTKTPSFLFQLMIYSITRAPTFIIDLWTRAVSFIFTLLGVDSDWDQALWPQYSTMRVLRVSCWKSRDGFT